MAICAATDELERNTMGTCEICHGVEVDEGCCTHFRKDGE